MPADPAPDLPRLAVVLLVDARGHVLLQKRDEGAPTAAGLWGMVGGHVEDGEDFDSAVYRELAEETGIEAADGALELWATHTLTYSDGDAGDYRVYAGSTDLADDDIVVGEGEAIVFVDPARTPSLDQAESLAWFLPRFLASEAYARLAGAGARR